MRNPSLRKCKTALRHIVKLYRRKKESLSPTSRQEIKELLETLQTEVMHKNKEGARCALRDLNALTAIHFKKTPLERAVSFTLKLIGALLFAIVVRQMWFEFYEIPTGSMRPTFKEKDRLVVSKNAFGINLPLTNKHILFDPNLVERSGVFIFTGKDMDIRDVDTLYFWIFPGKKQYIKRLMGKPGDTLYFYGGQMYGIDQDGHDITPSLQPQILSQIDHVPFISFSGKAITPAQPNGGVFSPVIFSQMNEPIAKLTFAQNRISGEMLPSGLPQNGPKKKVTDYNELWGFKNYAMARMLSKAELNKLYDKTPSDLPASDYYLELTHDPSFKGAKLEKDMYGRLRPSLGTTTSFLPLSSSSLEAIKENLYTARFIVQNGAAYRYGSPVGERDQIPFAPKMDGIPDGTYEFYHGIAYKISWQGHATQLPKDHPLYTFTPERLQQLFNLGIEFDLRFAPQSRFQPLRPSRFAYFKNGDFYAMGGQLYTADSPQLSDFVAREKSLAAQSLPAQPYFPFIDHGAPLKEGKIDKDFIATYGLTIPPNHYLALGDNYAMSSDSRDFGFVPEGNIRGAPDFIFWPFGPRFGHPLQPGYPFMNLPRAIIWMLGLIAWLIWAIHHRRHYALPMKID